MKILVNEDNFQSVIQSLTDSKRLAVDTESTGLLPFHGDRLFSIIVADEKDEYYFDFNIGGMRKTAGYMQAIEAMLNSCGYLFFINADYDCSILHFDGINIATKILDGGVMARLEYSLHMPQGRKSDDQFFSMDYLAKYYLKLKKDETVENYIKEHNLYGADIYGAKKPLYNRVPLSIMMSYGCSDARTTFDVCVRIIELLNAKDTAYEATRPKSWGKLMDKLADECKLTSALVAAKLRGIKLNRDYCERAIEYETRNAQEKLEIIKTQADINVNSPKQMQGYLRNNLGLELPKIIKKGQWTGGYSTSAETLFSLADKHDMPMFQDIVSAKRSQKKVSTYYSNYLKMMDSNEVIHCSLGQETTITGRLSSFAPNLQNLAKENYHEWAVRNSFKARPGYKLVFLDYTGQEMYIMVDLSGDQELIAQIKSGVDIYIAMAAMVKRFTGIIITRSQAKALALGVAYGQGIKLIATNLKCSESEASNLRNAFRKSLSKVMDLDAWCKKQAQLYGKIHNPYGRITYIEKGLEYKALNALIQGTAADCTKRAFLNVHETLKNYKSKLVLQVHDEIIIEMHESELHLIPDVQKIMSAAYPHRFLELKTDVEISDTTWAAKVKYVA